MANVGKAKVTVPRKKKVAGRDHMLAFITPNEAELLNRRAGRPGTTVVTRKNKVPAFPPGAPGGGPTGTGGPSSAGVGSNGGDTGGDAGGPGNGGDPGGGVVGSAFGGRQSQMEANPAEAAASATEGDTAAGGLGLGGGNDGGNGGTGGNFATAAAEATAEANPPPSGRIGAGPDTIGTPNSTTPTSTGDIGRANLQRDLAQSRQAREAGIMPGGDIGLMDTAQNVFEGLTEGRELTEDEEVGMVVTAVNQLSPVPGVGVQEVMDATRAAGTAVTSGIEAVTGAQAQGPQANTTVSTSPGRDIGGDGGPPNEQPRPTEGPNQPRRTGVPTRQTRRASDELPEPARQPAREGTILAGGLQGRTQVPEGRLSRTIATGG